MVIDVSLIKFFIVVVFILIALTIAYKIDERLGEQREQNIKSKADEDSYEYEVIETSMADIQEGDMVMGTDGRWHEVTLSDIETLPLYKVSTDRGDIVCSFNHQWDVWDGEQCKGTYSTIELHNQFESFKGMRLGIKEGAVLQSIEYDHDGECRCLEVDDSEDHQFEILTDREEPVFTHNCQNRMVCGKVDTTASLMALDNTLGTGVDGSIQGRGIVSVNGIMSHLQIYFEKHDWLMKWFKDRGLDEKGYPPEMSVEDEILLGEGEEEINLNEEVFEMDFEGIHKEINNSKRQKFQEIQTAAPPEE